ncbi:CshA/CshB family fibrillar adhesin-related protein [Nocardioides xinjiangensis]|uniref:CshA/CshB family fibrillar adhesin-related protein n=1 Tax=Nocardioides xinjiangensis TaxID=2817376 RepID=UPI001B304538|nr:CshA/CshB family fibrillar adhesin-related protein [Nocardioides sp. SYSU D00514]
MSTAAVVTSLLGALLAVVPVTLLTASPAEARYATHGTGTYLGAIDWFEWGAHLEKIPPAGLTRTNTRVVAGGTLATTCTLSDIDDRAQGASNKLSAYRPGHWGGDGLDDMYRIGAQSGSANQLISGLWIGGGPVLFHLSCDVTLDGVPVPLAGLVMADAEQSITNEYVQATIPAGADWRIIDRGRTAGCTNDTAVVRTGQTLRLAGNAQACPSGPTGVAFMEGATSADVVIQGGGASAIALGVMLFNDFGDAPASYGDAGALYSPGFTGDPVPQGTTALFARPLASPTQPAPRLGATVDSEGAHQAGPAAGADGADEDALAAPVRLRPTPGTSYTLPDVACTGPGVVSGWVDWNGNGTFEPSERSDQPSCTGSSVALTWDVPARPDTGPTFMRLRIGPNAAAVAGPTGVSTAGEVEDHAVVVVPRADYGDAPDTAGTTAADNGARHLVPDHDAARSTAPVMLGDRIDLDDDGAPGPAADGDDNAGVDDEDGVAFNTSLGYAAPVLRTGTDAITLDPVVNTLDVTASSAGFVSVWVDLNGDGDFGDDGEREVDAAPVVAGANIITFTEGVNPPDIEALVRVRYSTDASAVHSPVGIAPDGEVEDYRVLVERLIVPAACSPVAEPYYAMTFNSVTDKSGAGAPGTSARYPRVAVVRGEVVDAVATTGNPGSTINANGFFVAGDDAAWNLNGSGAATAVTFSFVRTGTSTPVAFNSVWTINDMDATERTDFVPDTQVEDYALTPGSMVAVSRSGGRLVFSGTVSGNNDTRSRYQVWFKNRSAVGAIWRGFAGSGFLVDGDGDTPVPTSCDDYGDAPDTYGTTLARDGARNFASQSLKMGADVEFDADGQPTAAADGDDTNRNDDEDAVAAPISVTRGEPSSAEVSVTNDLADPATLAAWLDRDRSGTFDADERVMVPVPAGSGTATYTVDLGAVTTTQDTYVRFRLLRGAIADPQPTGAGPVGEVEDHRVTVLNPALTLTKTSDATADSGPGDTVTYTVTLTNTGSGAFTAANPARVVDDLSAVLDDATYAGGATATVGGTAVAAPAYAEPRVSWSGPLAAGASVVITYAVDLEGGGDGHVRNTAFVPPPGDPNPPTPDCAQTARPCATTTTELPRLSITKTANRTQLPAVGQQVSYTVTVTNAGLGAYTADHPATFADDLSEVLDDATLAQADVTASRGTATVSGSTLAWTGTLAAGQSATVTYTLTYTGAGDQVLRNSACVPAAEAADADEACRTVSVPGSGLRHDKSVDPASGTPVEAGQVLTYTLAFENVGPTPATVDTTDDLDGVVDDAVLDPTSVTADAGLVATPSASGDAIAVTGSVPPGQTLEVTYRVQVLPWADQGDHVLTNVLACEPGEPAGCAPETTTNPVRHLAVTKTSDATADSRPGDQVTYTVTATNDGTGDFTATDPATLVDDLGDVLDDADFDGTATASAGSTSYAAPRLTWTGALAAGASVTVEYTVTLSGGGDGEVDNEVCTGAPRACAAESFDLPKLTIRKTSNRAQLPAAGNKITYTVTVTNRGPGDYTASAPASFTDDLSDVLDDATFDDGSIAASTGTATLVGNTLDWSGALPAGQSATVTYTLTYEETGNLVVDNRACIPLNEALDPDEPCRTVHTPGSGLRQTKKVDPRTGTSVVEGQVLTYTLTFENVGPAAATVDTVDDLSGVVDDADLLVDSISADAGLVVTPDAGGEALTITGSVPTGEVLTVTYRVRVRAFADQGDHVVTNALACQPGDPQPCDPTTTSNPVRHLVVGKTSDATADSKPGDTVTYTVRLRNDGAGDYTAAAPATVVDDLTGVLDDATFAGVANVNQGPAPTYDAPRLSWSGPLRAGTEVRVTYEVVLKGGGDGVVRNVAWQPADPRDPGPTPDCATATVPCSTESFDLPKLTLDKSADRADLPAVGQTVTYTVRVANAGPGGYTAEHPATFTDDLSDVTDDGTVGVPTATVGEATLDGDELSWTGVLGAPGDAAEVTYTVTYRGTGDRVLDNTACVPAAEAQDPAAACDTASVPGSGLVHRKTVDPASGTAVEVGDTLTYTLTFDNTAGAAAAVVDTTDDLRRVVDDATLDEASVTAGAGLTATPDPAEAPDTIAVTGTVPAGATRTVTYRVTVKPFDRQGDHVLTNALACEPGDPTPCAPATTSNPVRHLTLHKEQTSPASPDTGDRVTYTLTVRNDGAGDWTSADPAEVVDDLAGVLDDATWADDASASTGAVTFSEPELTWTGALAHGETARVAYSVVVTNLGDHRLVNIASVSGCALAECTPDPVVTPLPHVVPGKSATPAGGQPVQPGDRVTYTLTWSNDGRAVGAVDSTDDLSGVLDDAEVVQEPTSSDPAVTATRTGDRLRVTGPLAPGETVAVTYVVLVRPAGQHGDNSLLNVLAPDTPQVGCTVSGCTPVPPATTRHPVGDLVDWKTVAPSAGTAVRAGERVTYTLHFQGSGTGPVRVHRVDDLSGVLDDAALVAGPTASTPGLAAGAPVAGRISVTGTVPAGTTATVTYTVEVGPDGRRGDDRLVNHLVDPGQAPPTSCSTPPTARAGQSDCTSNPVAASDVDLALAKRVVSGRKVLVGDRIRYTLRVSNKGPAVAAGPIVVRDRLPRGLELLSAKGRGWECEVDRGADRAACTRTSALRPGARTPAVVLVARATAAATGRTVNVATVRGGRDTRPADNRDVAGVRVSAPPALPGTGFRSAGRGNARRD